MVIIVVAAEAAVTVAAVTRSTNGFRWLSSCLASQKITFTLIMYVERLCAAVFAAVVATDAIAFSILSLLKLLLFCVSAASSTLGVGAIVAAASVFLAVAARIVDTVATLAVGVRRVMRTPTVAAVALC